MKKLLLIFLLSPFLCLAQDPPKGSNTIVVGPVSFKQVVSVMLDAGYSFASKDSMDKVLLTDFRPEKKTKLSYRIRARVKDSTVYLSGQYKLGLEIHTGLFSSDPNELQVSQFVGWRTGGNRITFAQIQAVADSLHCNITYTKQ